MIKEGAGHHPHSLRDARPIADFISQQVQPAGGNPPPYLSGRISRSSFYGRENAYRYFPSEGIYITCRGPWFSPSFDRYSFELTRRRGVDQRHRSEDDRRGEALGLPGRSREP